MSSVRFWASIRSRTGFNPCMTHPTLEMRLQQRQRPARRPLMRHQWRDLLFLHWRVAPEVIQRTLPAGLYVDTFEGQAYLGLVPFYMHAIRPAYLPPLPGLSYFLETNVRTYVTDAQGRPGVWFYSLDANQWLAVRGARAIYRLPYFYARMQARRAGEGWVDYQVQRRGTAHTSHFRYRGVGAIRPAEPGSLAFFLVERYILYAQTSRGLAQGRVFHTPYPTQNVEVTQWDADLLTLNGFPALQRPPDHQLYSPGVAVDVFALQAV